MVAKTALAPLADISELVILVMILERAMIGCLGSCSHPEPIMVFKWVTLDAPGSHIGPLVLEQGVGPTPNLRHKANQVYQLPFWPYQKSFLGVLCVAENRTEQTIYLTQAFLTELSADSYWLSAVCRTKYWGREASMLNCPYFHVVYHPTEENKTYTHKR